MNIAVTSKEEILKVSRALVSERGMAALNMRAVAERLHVALGSLYNYFPSKGELVAATIESVWQDIFHAESACLNRSDFVACVESIFSSVHAGAVKYPNFFSAHSVSLVAENKEKARRMMNAYLAHIKGGLSAALDQDDRIRKDAFDDALTKGQVIDFVLQNLLMLLTAQAKNCAALLEIIKRALY